MRPQRDQVLGRRWLGDTIVNAFLLALISKGAEQPVEDDQDAAVVGVDVAGIAAMVHTMMAGRIEEKLDHRRQPCHQRGVNKELVHQRQRIGHTDPHRIEAKPDHRHIEQPLAIEDIQRALAHGGGEIHPFRGVMHHVRGPEPAHPVIGTVHPVIDKIGADKNQQPGPHIQLQIEQPVVVDERIYREHQHTGKQQLRHLIPHAEHEIADRLRHIEQRRIMADTAVFPHRDTNEHRRGDHENQLPQIQRQPGRQQVAQCQQATLVKHCHEHVEQGHDRPPVLL